MIDLIELLEIRNEKAEQLAFIDKLIDDKIKQMESEHNDRKSKSAKMVR
jgi:hypothetical protein